MTATQEQSSTNAARPSALRAFKHRDFTIFWSGALVSNTGSWLQLLTVPYVLFELTGSALWVGLVAVAQFVPQMVMSPLGGSLADRRPRRTLLLSTQVLMAINALCLWLVWMLGVHEPGWLLFFLAIGGVLNGINMPAWQSFVTDLVPRADLISAVTMNSLQFNASRAIGPGIAGLLLAALGAGWAFGLNALSFFFVIGALLAVRVRPKPVPGQGGGGVLRQFGAAIRYTRAQPGLIVVMIVTFVAGLLGNPAFSFTVVFAGAVYDVGPVALGLLNVAIGAGAVIATPLVSGSRSSGRLSSTAKWGMLIFSLTLIVFGASNIFAVGVACMMLVGACWLAIISAVNTSLQLLVEEQYRGRVMALRLMLLTLSFPLGGFVQGALADAFGAQQTVVGAGIVMLLVTLILMAMKGRIRFARLDDWREASGHR